MGFKKIFSRILAGLTVAAGLASLAVSALPWIPSGQFWFLHILGLAYPFILAGLILFLLFWAIRKSRWTWFCLLALLVGIQQIGFLVGFHFGKGEPYKQEGALRVLSWNVSRWDERNKEKRGGESYRRLMLDYIEASEADVLCFQEYFECTDPRYYASTIPVLQKMGYPYYHFYPSTSLFGGSFRYGLAIFSRYPILEAKSFPAGMRVHSEGICYADIEKGGKRTRVFNAHFETPGFTGSNYDASGNLKGGSGILQKIAAAYSIRAVQVREAVSLIKASNWPVVLCADLGDVPNSYAYKTLKGRLSDAFLTKGGGLGATYRFISPTLRIDYIFTGPGLDIVNLRMDKLKYSDHYPLICDLVSEKK